MKNGPTNIIAMIINEKKYLMECILSGPEILFTGTKFNLFLVSLIEFVNDVEFLVFDFELFS